MVIDRVNWAIWSGKGQGEKESSEKKGEVNLSDPGPQPVMGCGRLTRPQKKMLNGTREKEKKKNFRHKPKKPSKNRGEEV